MIQFDSIFDIRYCDLREGGWLLARGWWMVDVWIVDQTSTSNEQRVSWKNVSSMPSGKFSTATGTQKNMVIIRTQVHTLVFGTRLT